MSTAGENNRETTFDSLLNAADLSFDTVISNIEDYAIFILDAEGNIKTWNKGAEKIKGYKANEIIGQHFSIFYTKADKIAQLPDLLLNRARKEGKAEHEGWRLGKFEDKFWASVVISSIKDKEGKHIGFIKITRDLSERMAAEKTISEYEQDLSNQATKTDNVSNLYKTFVNEVEDYSIIMLNTEGVVIDWNKGATQLKGYTAEEVLGRHFSIFYPEEDRRGLLPETLLKQAEALGRTVHEGWRVKKDGTKFWAHVVFTALRNQLTGELNGYAKVTRDLTKEKEEEMDATSSLV